MRPKPNCRLQVRLQYIVTLHCRHSMSHYMQIIHIEPLAPSKPLVGAPCNGCGVCCLAEPCPLGMVLSRRRVGACLALRWSATAQQYRCGAISATGEVLNESLPKMLRWMAPCLTRLVARLARRWISAGVGCDSSLEPSSVASSVAPP